MSKANLFAMFLVAAGGLASLLLGAEIIGARAYAWIMGLLASMGGGVVQYGITTTQKKADIAAQAAVEAASAAQAAKNAVEK